MRRAGRGSGYRRGACRTAGKVEVMTREEKQKRLDEQFEKLFALWRKIEEMEAIAQSHDHDYFESCEVCGERGLLAQATHRYEHAAVRYLNDLMCVRRSEEEALAAAQETRANEPQEIEVPAYLTDQVLGLQTSVEVTSSAVIDPATVRAG